MPDPVQPGRDSDSLADVVELLLDKGVVINADIVVSVGETELLGIKLRAAIASFETASQYGLEFPSGTDMEAVEAASERRRNRQVTPAANPELSPTGGYSEADEASDGSEEAPGESDGTTGGNDDASEDGDASKDDDAAESSGDESESTQSSEKSTPRAQDEEGDE
ncbi:gas vesicle protein GvpJ [Halogeometricum sp. CBA1124]|uniref:gas vesicle protein GvpJ n=1 Tax=Halogeometricum sp. CBA1124 TaxID=2668071 RepID=UPI0014295511|nr:gas vesicle protein [Halogeometricum sp. CBA1124]